MTIDAKQIRGARAILKWSQADLAKRAGVNINSVKNIENELSQPRASMMEKLETVFDQADIEFTDNNGVKRADKKIVIYDDEDGLWNFFDQVYYAVRDQGAKVVVNGTTEELFFSLFKTKSRKIHENRMQELHDKNPISIRALIEEGVTTDENVGYAEYRTLPSEIFPAITTYTFGDKVGTFLWGEVTKIIVINNKDLADAHRVQFEMMWEKAKAIS